MICRFLSPLLLALVAAGCSGGSEEERVLAVITAAETAAEERDTSDVMKLIADDYSDAQGFDKAQLQSYLRGYFLLHPKIELVVRTGDVELETATRARVRVDVTMLGTQIGGGGSNESLTGDAQSLQVELRLQGSDWRVTRVDRIAR